MRYTGKQLNDMRCVTNVEEENINNYNIGLRLNSIKKYSYNHNTVNIQNIDTNDDNEFILTPGYYEAELIEGCDIQDNIVLNIEATEESIRNGINTITNTIEGPNDINNIKIFLNVIFPISIKKGYTIAQIFGQEAYLL